MWLSSILLSEVNFANILRTEILAIMFKFDGRLATGSTFHLKILIFDQFMA